MQLRPRRELTAAQQLIWTSQRLHPKVPLANMATLSRITGPIDTELFAAAVETVVASSDVLRTTIREIDGAPYPTVSTTAPVRTQVVFVPVPEVEAWCDDRISEPLDVSEAAYDSVLLRHGDDDWSWWMNIHHVATDAASSALVFRSVAAAYAGDFVPGGSYEALASDLTEARGTERWQRAMDYWRSWPTGGAATGFYRPDRSPGTEAERVVVPTSGRRLERLEELLAGRFRLISHDLSLTVTLAVAVAAYLYRLDEDADIVIGIPIHHRTSPEARATIGPLVELFPLRIDVDRTDTFATLQQQVARSMFELLGNAQPGTSPRQTFDVVLNVHGATFGQFGAMPTRHRWIHPGHIDSHHRLRIQALDYDGDGALELALDVNHRIADSDHRRRAADHFGRVLDAMGSDPDRPIRSVGLADMSELSLLSTFTSPSSGTPLQAPAPDVVARALAAAGSKTAIREGAELLDGATLDARIDRVATRLNEAGIGRGDLVAIEMPIGIDAVVAIHGVLRSGAGFVPIDPTYPEARRDLLRADCGARLRLESLAVIDALTPAEPDGHSGPRRAAGMPARLDDLAYVIYTSGSTGTPKGVPITHRGLAEYLGFARDAYLGGDPPVMALFTSLSFDLTLTTLFLPLLSGGQIVVHPDGGLPALRQIVDDGSVTTLKATPSHLELLVRMIGPDHPLDRIIVGGEAFTTGLADRLLDALGGRVEIYNEYGPTEAVVGCMIHRYDRSVDPGPQVPIGRPAPGVALHVLDSAGHPVPIGVPGELFVHRPGMADGYLNRPAETTARFVPTDIDGTPTLYRTGDRVRMLDADRMVYLGRVDSQIKVGGIRIEPGEIEAAALSVAGVRAAFADLWRPGTEKRVEYCVRCGLGSDVPDTELDEESVCNVCRSYEIVAPQAKAWFRTEDDLVAELDAAASAVTGDYDVIHLLSGGKDSTYALYRLAGLGVRILALTLDNGFISDGAKENIRRATEALGVDHEMVSVDGMAEIFRDSLERHSNVCNGCYKTIYTVALRRADELGVPVIVTGLSRGQFFETRLVPEQFADGRFDAAAIDEAVEEARRAYHATPDAVSEHLDVGFLADGSVLDNVRFIDFYRYVDVELTEVYDALERSGTWIRPVDTGRSTNCLINSAGIHVHTLERGHHNYAMPYSWDVRLGHKTRAEAMHELDDPIDEAELSAITKMLADVGYEPRPRELLTLWLELDGGADVGRVIDEVRDHLAATLPDHAVPDAVETVASIPLTVNGKVDSSSLPAPSIRSGRGGVATGRPPSTSSEVRVAGVWQQVLGVSDVAADDDFFALGGASLQALEMIVRLGDLTGLAIPDSLAFRHRTVAELAEALDSLRADEGNATSRPGIPALPPGPLPLSAGEEALLFDWRRDPSDRRYNVARSYRALDDVDSDRFDEAVRKVVMHQPTLHTSFGPGRRALSIEEALSTSSVDAAGSPIGAVEAQLNERPFDLVNGPLVTVHHIRAKADDGDAIVRRILIRTHHIVSDAGSLDVMWNQIDLAYRGQELPELATTYAAHGAWLRSRDVDPAALWSADTGARVGHLELRTERPGSDGYVHLTAAVSASQMRSAPGATAFATALTALVEAVGPYHSRPRFEVAVTASLRDHPDLAHVVGYFLNPLPLLVDTAGCGTSAELAERIDEILAAALELRSVPFASVARSARERGVAVPESRVMLAVEDLAPAVLDGVEIEHEILASGRAVNDLTFFVQIRDELVEIGCEYRGSVVDRHQAEQLLRRFDDALGRVVSMPLAPVLAQSSEAVVEGDPLGDDLPLVPVRISSSVAAEPASAAVSCGDEQLSYDEFDAAARLIGARLRAVGVDPGDRVAVVVPRSVHLPVAIWATWLVGASYVPIDVSQPAARVAELLDRSSVSAVLTAGEVGGTELCTTIDVRESDPAVQPLVTAHATEADDEAYLMFTSGSTGRSKGVKVSHGNLAASVAARLQWYERPVERFLLLSSAGFDSSVAGLFWTLATGGELIIPTEAQIHDVDALVELVSRRAPSHTLMVPSLYGALLQRAGASLPGLRTVVVAGEACPPELVRRHRKLSGAELVNEYGPTEATVWATAHRCDGTAIATTVPIGGPVPGVSVSIVDEESRAVPTDVAGELVIHGPTVAAGYVPESEPEDRFGIDAAGDRWYRTGDRAALRAHGAIDFLGRVDDQLSVGGVRIEPAEIETVLTSVDGVVTALASERDGRIVAWIEVEGDAAATRHEIRSRLESRLPPSHVPERVGIVEQLPRSANGKIDRSAAQRLPLERSGGGRPGAPIDDAHLAAVVSAFTAAFDGRPFGPDDDFFESGGDSLRAVSLVQLLETIAGRRVGIGELVDSPTPRSLAARTRTEAESGEYLATMSPLVEWLRRAGDRRPLIVLPPGGGNLLRYRPLVDALDPDIPVLGVRLPGADARSEAVDSVEEQAAAMLAAVDSAGVTGPYRLLGWSTGGLIAWEMARSLLERGDEIELVALVDTVMAGLHVEAPRSPVRKYAEMFRDEGARASFDEGFRRLSERADFSIARLRYRTARRRGRQPTMLDAERQLGPVVRRASLAYSARPLDVPTLYLAASESGTELTVEPWTLLLRDSPAFDVLTLEGTHFLPEDRCIIGPRRAPELVDALHERLID